MDSRYRVTRLLATGGMAEVYLGVARGAEGFEKPVAIKRILPHLAQDPRVVEMFLSEAKVARRLQHQNVVSVIDVGRGEGGLFLVMEAVNGWDLRLLLGLARRAERPFPLGLAAWITTQVNAGLMHAYARGVTAHRDVADANVLVSAEGEVKVADFGIARAELLPSHTEPGSFKGRVMWAAPEMLAGGKATAASDQFALGVLLCDLLSLGHPFGAADNLAAYIRRLDAAPPDVARIPAPLREIVARMLAADPARRFSPAELSRSLGSVLASCGEAVGPQELAAFVESLGPPPPPWDAEATSPPPIQLGHNEWLGDGSEWQAIGPALDESGRVVDARATSLPGTRSPIVAPVDDEEPLELAREITTERKAAPAPPPEWTPPVRARKGRGVWRAAFTVLGLVALGAVVVLAWPMLRPHLREALPGGASGVLRVDSQPSGATVLIDGREVGTTPLAVDNLWPQRQIALEVRLRGHEPWHGSFLGGQEDEVTARLVRRGAGAKRP